MIARSSTRSPLHTGSLRSALLVALGGLAGCSGGSSVVGDTTAGCVSGARDVICLTNCNLGCSSTGCARTDIAQNEVILLEFSDAVDPASVTPSSIRFRTASGDQPVGEFFVNGRIVEFKPTLLISGGTTYFGFAAGETYSMTIPGGKDQPAVVRSTAGRPFEKTLSCTLQSTRGIVDINGAPPRVQRLVSPTTEQLGAAPLDIDIVLEFNELIDATPFVSGTQSPVTFSVRRTRDASGGGKECNPFSDLLTLPGTQRLDYDAGRDVSVLTFKPSQPLPANVCIEINVTDQVSDLSGRSAQPQAFNFLTLQQATSEFSITEPFDGPLYLDEDASSATWANGLATFSPIGGDGRHGAFNKAMAVSTTEVIDGRTVHTLNTDSTIIPGSYTSTGSAMAITDGKFYFASFVVPGDVHLRFLGTQPPIVTAVGRIDIQGVVEVNGVSLTAMPATGSALGQEGSAGGVFGGAGGKGGDRCGGVGPGATFNGSNGGTVRVIGGHAYATSTVDTGGRGSTLFPASGLNIDRQFAPITASLKYCVSAVAGGGGGGYWTPGVNGVVQSNNHPDPSNGLPPLLAAMGPTAPAGVAFPLFPLPGTAVSSRHFLVGGSGGGGAGSHPCLSLNLITTNAWSVGAAGAGGGGVVALRAGGLLRVAPAGRVFARGGNSAGATGTASSSVPAPGGGGSGGSILLQSGATADIAGTVDVRGGTGGLFDRFGGTAGGAYASGGAAVQIKGGDGAPGFVRLELPTAPAVSALASMLPAATANNVGQLVERDETVGCRSKFYSTEQIFGPEFSRYEIYATVDGVAHTYSDDAAVSNEEAGPGAPVRVMFQAAQLDLTTNEPIDIRPWRTRVRSTGSEAGIDSDGRNGFRFQLQVDYTLAQNVTIDRVVVVYRQ